MLIRSQNKEYLCNLNSIYGIAYEETHGYKKGKTVSTNHEICVDTGVVDSIGVYSTKEKALKVLDMIQEEYQYNERCKARGEEAGTIPLYVFQMPKDEEVEE